tara:strand:+ start:3916 stop:4455 length:540 start_codon:yes stop_codon:yes gene_type:complete
MVEPALDFLAVSPQHATGAAGGALLRHGQAHGTDFFFADVVVILSPLAREPPDQGFAGWIPAQRLGSLQFPPLLCMGGQARVGERVKVVRDAVVLCDGTQVRAVLKPSLHRKRCDVFGARLREVGVFPEGRVDVLELLDVAHGVGGARAAAAATALASRTGFLCDRRVPVWHGDGLTLF